MQRKRLLWQLYPSYLLITLAVLLAVSWFANRTMHTFYYQQTAEVLELRARLIEQQIAGVLQNHNWSEVNDMCHKLGSASRTRITVILPDGKVVGESDKDPDIMEDHSNRPEIDAALNAGRGESIRFSNTLKKNLMYVAVPVKQQDETIAVIRTAIPVTGIDQALADINLKIIWAAIIIAVCAAGVCLVVSRHITRPVEQMRQAARRFAQGDLQTRVAAPQSAELAYLAESLNEMARQLHTRIETITRQRNEQEAVLSSMIEGVLAVDAQGRLISINQAAAQLLHIDPDQARGHFVQEIIRNPELQEFVETTLKSNDILEANITLSNNEDKHFRLHGSAISDFSGRRNGAVVVLNDMTRLLHLENIRRDFVANVSHELKTPVTSIKGFVETLQEGAIHDPEKAGRFLDILARQTDRLNAIIEDLLSLSRIEQDQDARKIDLSRENIESVIKSAIELTQVKAAHKNISIDLKCDPDMESAVNPELLEQALVNLIDNAIKYSNPESEIEITAYRQDNEIAIAIRDNGCGIDPDHWARIFERFYVVDKARSRKLGGTGLGLAIVKHIAQSHGGRVTVKSTLEQGSTFTLYLPIR
ncbi:MAG: HAMP domain-containing protein [Sedimentisphaerales bacterium]|nr:HAMP domain-containing protein [Sedimentisphaerales bacterium]